MSETAEFVFRKRASLSHLTDEQRREHRLLRMRDWRVNNAERTRKYWAQYYAAHRDRINESRRKCVDSGEPELLQT